MTTNDTFERRLESWLEAESAHRVPDHLDQVLLRTVATRQRPGWSSLERWLPVMDTVAPGRSASLRPVLFLALLGALVIALIGVALVGIGRSSPTISVGLAENGRIYVADGPDIRSYAADGTDPQTVVAVPAGVSGLAVSPDGKRLAYHVPVTPNRLEVLELASGRTTSVPMPTGIEPGNQISWAPTSDRVALPAFSGDQEFVLVAPVDGGPATILGDGTIDPALGIWWPAWSPTGDMISFVAVDKAIQTSAIHLIRPDGTGLERLATPSVGTDPGQVTWAPDPAVRRLLFSTGTPDLTVHILDLDTKRDMPVATSFWPTWSPNGDRISYWGTRVKTTADALAGTSESVVVLEALPNGDGCDAHPELADQHFCGPAAFSPDGQRLLAPDITGNSILSVMADGSGQPFVIPLVSNVKDLGSPVAWQPLRP